VPALKKSGWSDAKVARWLAEKSAAAARRQQEQSRGAGHTPEVDSWIGFLSSALASKATGQVGVLIHEYSGSVQGERIRIKRREPVRVADVTPERLWTMEMDVLYEFTS